VGLYIHHPSSYEHDTGAHPENASRLRAIEAELETNGWLGLDRREAPAATREQLLRVHSLEHLRAIEGFCVKGGGMLDADTVVSEGSFEAARHAVGGAVALVDELLAGDARVGASLHRPPGHHAEAARAMGFCLFNNVAVAARHALDSLGAERVFILDWDVHHGDGTHDIFRATDEVLFASIHQGKLFPGTGPLHDVGARGGEGYSINLPVPKGSFDDVWVSLLEHIVIPAAEQFAPELVLISAGYDGHADDEQGGCLLDASSFAEMARHVRALGEQVGAPVGGVLEGGYALDALADSVVATMEALASDEPPDSVAPDFLTTRAASHIGHYWTL
jgi:acetoin utilization deacetylase AcuC-like enzyme